MESHATYILISSNRLVDVARGEFVQLLVVTEDDDGHVDRAENRQLMRLLEQASFPLEEGTNTNSVSTQQSSAARLGLTRSDSCHL